MSAPDPKNDSILRNLGAFVGHIAAAVRQDVGGPRSQSAAAAEAAPSSPDRSTDSSTDNPVLERRTTEVRTVDLGTGPAKVTKTVIERIEIAPAESPGEVSPREHPRG